MQMKTIIRPLSGILLLCLSYISSGCSKDAQPPRRNFDATLNVNGLKRSYIVNLPPGYYQNSDTMLYPMIIALHGTGGSAAQFEADYGFSRKADEAGFVAVYPDGVASTNRLRLRTWNAGACCDYAMKNGIDDVSFINGLIDKMAANYRIDPERVYVTGMSNGGMMAYRLAAELSGKIAAIAPVSCSMVYSPAASQPRHVPVLHLHSVLDSIVPYHGGSNRFGYYFPPVDSVLNVWALRNGCRQEPVVVTDNSNYKQIQWINGEGAVMINHYLTQDGGHSWPGGKQVRPRAAPPSTAINANDLIWDFFRQYRLE